MIYSRSDIQTAIISCVLSFLPGSPQFHARMNGKGLKLWSQRMCIILLQSTVSSPYVHTYTRGLGAYIYIYETYYHWENWLLTDYCWPWKIQTMGSRMRNGFGENISCFRSLEEHSLRETAECYRIAQGTSLGTDSSHTYLWERLVTPNNLPPANRHSRDIH